MRAVLAIEGMDNLLAAADARHRCGSWKAGAALDAQDFGLLADAEDIVRRGWPI
jgi:hypothetical protein